jgi:large subunit ribosomal protein L10
MVSEKKKGLVQSITELVKEYPIIGIVNLENLPAQQFQKMRRTLLANDVILKVNRKRLLAMALENGGKKNIGQLKDKIKGMPALLFSKGNPFALYSTIQKNKSDAPAKAGQTAPKDIVVQAGMTNFAPGPIISELAAVGIKTKVTDGKLEIIADVVVAKEGDEISAPLAETLKRLDVKPMEIGLDLVAVWEDGLVFVAKDLRVDEQEYMDNFTRAAAEAMNLAIESAYTTDQTIELLLQKAFRDGKAVALEGSVLNDETAPDILGKVEREALAIKDAANIPDAPSKQDAPNEAKAEEQVTTKDDEDNKEDNKEDNNEDNGEVNKDASKSSEDGSSVGTEKNSDEKDVINKEENPEELKKEEQSEDKKD